jgi:hypothetical protein
MRITLIKQINGRELVQEFEETYGSLERLQNLHERNPENMKVFIDLEDWNYYKDHPKEVITQTRGIVTQNLTLGKLELELLSFIKNNHPRSIRELAEMIHKDIRTVHPKVKELEREGLIELKKGPKNRLEPVLNYDKIEIEV